MRFKWITYPEARQILDSSGLTERIKQAKKDYSINLLGHVMDSDVADWIKEMKREEWFDTIPESERRPFFLAMNDAFKNRDHGACWKVKRHDEEHKEPVEVEDFLILSGCRASHLLPKEELFDYRRFGFSSVGEIAGTVGAAIEAELHDDSYHAGLKWQTKRPDGRTLVSEITGDTHCDLRVYQNDITPYETTDPLGNKVHYRPQTNADEGTVAAYHTNEGAFLAAVLKWVDQLNIQAKTLEEKAQETIKWVNSLGQGGGTCAEHFGGYDNDPRFFFVNWNFPIPVLDSSGFTSGITDYHLLTQGEGDYGIYIGNENELVFFYEPRGKPASKKRVAVSFLPTEADNVIKGLLYQCAKGLGRTSARQLIEILEYRFSPGFPDKLFERRTQP